MILAEFVQFKHGLYKSCDIEWFEGIMLEPCLLQPCFHVAVNNALEPRRLGAALALPKSGEREQEGYVCIYIYIYVNNDDDNNNSKEI